MLLLIAAYLLSDPAVGSAHAFVVREGVIHIGKVQEADAAFVHALMLLLTGPDRCLWWLCLISYRHLCLSKHCQGNFQVLQTWLTWRESSLAAPPVHKSRCIW